MVDRSNQELLAVLIERRDAFAAAVDALERVFGPSLSAASSPLATPPVEPPRSKVGRLPARTAKPMRVKQTSPAGLSLDPLVAVREEAILTALKRNNGLATSKILRAAMPNESNLNEEQRGAAYRNCVQRLKVKGVIARTGDTWSTVGIGSPA